MRIYLTWQSLYKIEITVAKSTYPRWHLSLACNCYITVVWDDNRHENITKGRLPDTWDENRTLYIRWCLPNKWDGDYWAGIFLIWLSHVIEMTITTSLLLRWQHLMTVPEIITICIYPRWQLSHEIIWGDNLYVDVCEMITVISAYWEYDYHVFWDDN